MINKIFFLLLLFVFFFILNLNHELFSNYIKKINKKKIIKYTNLNANKSYKLEKNCLERLQKNFKCICKDKKQHFPKIVKTYEGKKYYIIEMTNIGKSINKIKEKKNINKELIDEQIKCILHNLEKSKVTHLDMHNTGKNMTLNDNILGLIDFNAAIIDGNPESDKIRNKYEKTKKNNKNQFMNILNRIMK
tara:strand:+ start:60 stop:632 length:573 start_codon:yes stop_codon:yes gene_type:complete